MLKFLHEKAQKLVENRVRKSLDRFLDEKILSRDSLQRYANRAIQLGRADLAAEIVQSDTGDRQMHHHTILERIINESQLTGVAFFHRGLSAARAVGRVVVNDGRSFGTGFMISPRLLMTNNHVLESSRSAAASVVEFDFARDRSGQLMQRQTFQLEPQLFFRTNDTMDYTIVAVEEVNGDGQPVINRGWLHLIQASGKAIVGERLNIIQHPDAKPQMIALRENTLVAVDGDFLHYSTDTRPGSSGSPVLNDQFQLAALHHAGVPERNNRRQVLKKDGTPFRAGDDPADVRWVANEGARVSRIIENVQGSGLSAELDRMFQAAFQEPPIGAPPRLPSGGESGAGPLTGNGGVGSDGIARWNFQLTFGPVGNSPAAEKKSEVIPSLAESPTASSTTIASVDTEGDSYFDEEAEEDLIDTYYNGIDPGDGGDRLFMSLSKLVTGTQSTVFSYRTARHLHLYPLIDRHPDGSLKSVYSGEVVSDELINAEIESFEKAVQDLAISEGLETADFSDERLDTIDLILESNGPFNCEHVVPQSWFNKQQPMKADLHHLFACEPNCNSFRSNIPYWEFDDDESENLRAIEVALETTENLAEEGHRPACGIREGRKFEPDANKGAAARATLYFLLRYPGEVGDIKSGPKLELTKSRVEILLKWSEADPPSLWEKHRNAEIAKSQGNRNPLIDHPEWSRLINFDLGFG